MKYTSKRNRICSLFLTLLFILTSLGACMVVPIPDGDSLASPFSTPDPGTTSGVSEQINESSEALFENPSGNSSESLTGNSEEASSEHSSSLAESSAVPPESTVPAESSESTPSEEPSVPSESSESPPAPDATVSFLACPDNIIHPSVFCDALERAAAAAGKTPVYTSLHTAEYDFAPVYENVASAVRAADISYVNVETLIGGTDYPISGYPMFNVPAAAGETLLSLGFDVFNLAHNHMLDSGNDKYLKNCNDFFTSRGGKTIGYYPSSADTANITVVEKNGIRIAFLAYTYSTNGVSLSSSSSTVIPYFSKDLVGRQVAIARQQADFIIVSCHWGNEDSYVPNALQTEYMAYLASLNVDVALGMHPHVIQPMSWQTRADGRKMLLVYSLGNFVSGMQDAFNMLGGMLSFDIVRRSGVVTCENVLFTPIVTHYTTGTKVRSDDTGYRNFKIYLLRDYTDSLAAVHNVTTVWEKSHKTTLVGGKFSVANLWATVEKYIPAEFLQR